MEKEKIEKIKQGLKCCGNNSPIATCDNCPYDDGYDCTQVSKLLCTSRLLTDCGELVAELTGAQI